MWNPFRRADPEDDELAARADERTWPTRLAWLVLVGGAAVLLLRCGVATVVEIHGDGMAPTLLTGDHVLLIRGTWGLGAGDLVVYDPTPPAPPAPAPEPAPQLPGPREGRSLPRHDGPRQPLRNTAVVDVDDLDLGDEWQAVQRRSGVAGPPAPAPSSLRVGRILAVPGDRITFGEHGGALGLAINGRPLAQEIGAPLRLAVRGPQDTGPPRPGRVAPPARRSASAAIRSSPPARARPAGPACACPATPARSRSRPTATS